MLLRDLVEHAAKRFEEAGISSATVDAELQEAAAAVVNGPGPEAIMPRALAAEDA